MKAIIEISPDILGLVVSTIAIRMENKEDIEKMNKLATDIKDKDVVVDLNACLQGVEEANQIQFVLASAAITQVLLDEGYEEAEGNGL
jgi:hypothetical protein